MKDNELIEAVDVCDLENIFGGGYWKVEVVYENGTARETYVYVE